MAMKFKAGLPDFVDVIHVYPTMSEALKIGAQAFRRGRNQAVVLRGVT